MTRRYPERTALFAGSFDPFTIGHMSVVERGLEIFDTVVIGVGFNAEKAGASQSVEERVAAIRKAVAGLDGVEVMAYSGLTVDAAREAGARFLLRGVRSVADFEYERSMADMNRLMSGLETVLLYTLPEHSMISSSVVRDLKRYGADVSAFLPPSRE